VKKLKTEHEIKEIPSVECNLETILKNSHMNYDESFRIIVQLEALEAFLGDNVYDLSMDFRIIDYSQPKDISSSSITIHTPRLRVIFNGHVWWAINHDHTSVGLVSQKFKETGN